MCSYLVQTDGTTPAVDEPNVASTTPAIQPRCSSPNARSLVFPCDTTHFKWNADQHGPFVIPKAGATVMLSPSNIALYQHIISNYEGNTQKYAIIDFTSMATSQTIIHLRQITTL